MADDCLLLRSYASTTKGDITMKLFLESHIVVAGDLLKGYVHIENNGAPLEHKGLYIHLTGTVESSNEKAIWCCITQEQNSKATVVNDKTLLNEEPLVNGCWHTDINIALDENDPASTCFRHPLDVASGSVLYEIKLELVLSETESLSACFNPTVRVSGRRTQSTETVEYKGVTYKITVGDEYSNDLARQQCLEVPVEIEWSGESQNVVSSIKLQRELSIGIRKGKVYEMYLVSLAEDTIKIGNKESGFLSLNYCPSDRKSENLRAPSTYSDLLLIFHALCVTVGNEKTNIMINVEDSTYYYEEGFVTEILEVVPIKSVSLDHDSVAAKAA